MCIRDRLVAGRDHVVRLRVHVAGIAHELVHVLVCLLYTSCRIDSYGEKDLDEDEFLEVEKIPLAQAVEMAERNEIFDAKTQVLILRAARLVEQGKL